MKKKDSMLWCFRIISPVLFYLIFSQIMAVALMGIFSVVFAAVARDGRNPMDMAYEYYMGHLLLVTVIMSAAVLPFFSYFYKRDRKLYGGLHARQGEKIPARQYGYVALAGVGLCVAANTILSWSNLGQIFDGYEEVAKSLYRNNLVFELLAMGLLIPLTEELLFRGLCFQRMRERMAFLPSALLSSLLFGVYHGNVMQGVYAGILGFGMCWVYEKYRSFAAPYVFHAAANIASVLITETVLGRPFHSMAGSIAAVAVGLAVLLFAIYRIHNIRRYRGETTFGRNPML